MAIEYRTLGRFNGEEAEADRIRGFQELARQDREELDAAHKLIARFKADLLECREYIEDHVDVIDGSNGEPMPNRAMALVSMIDESLHGVGF